jgi:predicted adenylyl cyclase CyaB
MPSNIETKARVADMKRLRRAVETLCGPTGEVLLQEDTFFDVRKGRLKLRAFPGGRGELIWYERPDEPGPKKSDYIIAPVADAAALKAILEHVLRVRAVVRKKRTLYMSGQTRIHLDEVEGLGNFMELEVVLATGQPEEEGRRIAEALLRELAIPSDDLCTRAYVDMLER